ncbi:MAG: hypothetical protein K8F91_00575, partial [Candidatus Obscuribacterales bacterium]|nr:hypothetical protein [Candidatus Obscuribacterales bacterium]
AMTIAVAGMASLPALADSQTAVTADKQIVAKRSGRACSGGACASGNRMMESFGMTDAQLEKLNTLKLDFKSSVGPKFAELKSLESEFRDMVTKPDTSKADLLALQSKINTVKSDLCTARAGFVADRIAVLTDEQKAKLRKKFLSRNVMGSAHHGKKRFHSMKGEAGPVNQTATLEANGEVLQDNLG